MTYFVAYIVLLTIFLVGWKRHWDREAAAQGTP